MYARLGFPATGQLFIGRMFNLRRDYVLNTWSSGDRLALILTPGSIM